MCDIYLDYAATTPVDPEIQTVYFQAIENQWHNPSSAYAYQISASIHQIKQKILQCLGLSLEYDLVFTSGATESINTILKGVTAYQTPCGSLLSSSIEHSAVTETLQFIQRYFHGTIITVNADTKGTIDPQSLESKLTPDVVLCSVIVVQNEIGTIQPVREIYRIIKAYNPSILIHLDAAQAFGKLPFSQFMPYGDFISFSGHKFYVPKGIGGLIFRKNSPFVPLLHGGGQQDNLRGGTLNYPLILALYHGFMHIREHLDEWINQSCEINRYLEQQLHDYFPQIQFNVPSDLRVSHICSLSIPGYHGETIRNYLASHQIWLSTGSACSGHQKKKNILSRLNRQPGTAESSIRLSVSHLTQPRQIDRLVHQLRCMIQERILV